MRARRLTLLGIWIALAGCGDKTTGTGGMLSSGGGVGAAAALPTGGQGGGVDLGAGGAGAGDGTGDESGTGGGAGTGDMDMGGSGPGIGSGAAAGGDVRVTAGPPSGNRAGACAIPADARPEDVSSPRTVVGTGTPDSCTGAAFVAAVARGGVITFACGPDPLKITLDHTAKVVNDTGPKIVIDGGGKITLSGGGKVRILYQNTCDQAQKWTTSHCDDQPEPQLTLQNLTFVDGNSTGETIEGGGGGAVFARGGRLKVINSRFFNNVCDDTGPDLGGAAIRVLSQSQGLPVYVVQSTFGGAPGLGNVCSNGAGLSSIDVSFMVLNSNFSDNRAIGKGANPAQPGTPGGGSGGAIYNDGNTYTLTVCGTTMTRNTANEGGGAIFYVSNDLTGTMMIRDSTLSMNPSAGFETQGLPGIFVLSRGTPQIINSTLSR